MTPILITGASGYLGRNLLEQLAARGIDDIQAAARTPGPLLPGVTWHDVDLLEPGAPRRLLEVTRPKTVFHLAWCATPGVYWASPENKRWLAATTELAAACPDLGIARLVAAGSCAEYDWTGAGLLDENVSPLGPATPYGRAKHAAHLAIADIHRRTGLSYAWLRIFWTCGRHEHPDRLVPSVIRGLMDKRDVLLTDGTQAIDIVAGSDLARGFVAAAGCSDIGAFDLASGDATAVREVVERIAAKMGADTRSLRFGARPTPAGTPAKLVGNAVRLRHAAGWLPQSTIERGLGEAVAWWTVL